MAFLALSVQPSLTTTSPASLSAEIFLQRGCGGGADARARVGAERPERRLRGLDTKVISALFRSAVAYASSRGHVARRAVPCRAVPCRAVPYRAVPTRYFTVLLVLVTRLRWSSRRYSIPARRHSANSARVDEAWKAGTSSGGGASSGGGSAATATATAAAAATAAARGGAWWTGTSAWARARALARQVSLAWSLAIT